MITLFRMLRCWQLKTKWRSAFWRFIDRQATELIRNPQELEKHFIDSLTRLIQESGAVKPEA